MEPDHDGHLQMIDFKQAFAGLAYERREATYLDENMMPELTDSATIAVFAYWGPTS